MGHNIGKKDNERQVCSTCLSVRLGCYRKTNKNSEIHLKAANCLSSLRVKSH